MNKTSFYIPIVISFSVVGSSIAVHPPQNYNATRILDAIRQVETGGEKDPANAVGDDGKAIGPFQIHYVYWKDAVDFDSSIGGKYSDCKDEAYAKKIIVAYWTRYAPNWSDETLSRVHNGGPKGNKKAKTLNYWQKVRKNLQKLTFWDIIGQKNRRK